MRRRADVAVIIPTYNRSDLVSQSIDSILGQSRPPEQVVVVDDGSTDATATVLASYGDRIQVRRQANAGKPAALNRTMTGLRADYLWIFDDDDVALPDALERHLAYLQEHPEVDFSYSGCYFFDGAEPPGEPDPKRLYDAIDDAAPEFFLRCLEIFPFSIDGMLVPLACYRAAGPFDESMTFGEDYEMILRLARCCRGGKLASPTFMVRQHDRPRGPAYEKRAAVEREAAWHTYEQKTFLRLRDELDLDDYLPINVECGQHAERCRRALLQRSCVMARHGLFPQALDDMRAAMDLPCSEPLAEAERAIGTRMLNIEPALLRGQGAWLDSVRRLLKSRATPLLDACVIGLGWRMQREWRRREYSSTLLALWSLYRLAGLQAVPRLTQRVWNKSFRNSLASG